jgi:hypothetical protein
MSKSVPSSLRGWTAPSAIGTANPTRLPAFHCEGIRTGHYASLDAAWNRAHYVFGVATLSVRCAGSGS